MYRPDLYKKLKIPTQKEKRYNFFYNKLRIKGKKYKEAEDLIKNATTEEEKAFAFNQICEMLPCWLKVFACNYAKTDLKLQNFEDCLNDCFFKIITKLKNDIKRGFWSKDINCFNTTLYSIMESTIKKAAKQDLIFIKTNDLFAINDFEEVLLEQLEELDENIAELYDFEEKYFKTMDIQFIYNVFKLLRPKEELILCERCGFYDGKPKTFTELSKKYKLSKQDICWLEGKALNKIRRNPICEKLKEL